MRRVAFITLLLGFRKTSYFQKILAETKLD